MSAVGARHRVVVPELLQYLPRRTGILVQLGIDVKSDRPNVPSSRSLLSHTGMYGSIA
jgi:hypothetical protein